MNVGVVFGLRGECQFSGTWTAITAARGFNANILSISDLASTYIRYTTGGTSALQLGEVLTGGTSAATALLVAQAVENGTAGSSDRGILFLRILSGTPAAAGETWTGGTTSGTVVTAQAPITLKFKGIAKAALISVETASINFTLDGTIPTVTSGTNYGHCMVDKTSYVVEGWDNMVAFQCINSVAASGAVVKYSIFF